MKLIVCEPESDALRRFLLGRIGLTSCALARVEVLRAVVREGAAATDRARGILVGLDLIALDDALLDAAGELQLDELRSLDAIHLAAARELGADLEMVVTYDHRMGAAARALGIAVAAPAEIR